MRNYTGLWIFSLILLALDIYVFQVIRFLSSGLNYKMRIAIYVLFWAISIASVIIIFLLPKYYFNPAYKDFITHAFSIVIGLFILKIIFTFFFLIDDIRRFIIWISTNFGKKETVVTGDNGITRSAFLSWLGIGVGSTIFSSLIFGFSNKYNYRIKKIKLQFPNLPNAFKGLKIVQLSDIHSGSFNDPLAVKKGIDLVLQQKPDLILFTGDLVNNIVDEMEPYKEIFASLKAPMGVYSILGNHDYGDYYFWEDRTKEHLAKEELYKETYKQELIQKEMFDTDTIDSLVRHHRLYSPMQKKHLDGLKNLQKEMGWKLLLNENAVIEKENDKIALIGVENWGTRSNFPKYGKLDEAYKGVEHIPFKILLSHDPSHWDAEVNKKFNDINLTLSGHTHGMQFGVEIPWLKWSPIQYVYKQWAGLYEKNAQRLYVNRGFGFLGYPGRVGILPEITLIELA